MNGSKARDWPDEKRDHLIVLLVVFIGAKSGVAALSDFTLVGSLAYIGYEFFARGQRISGRFLAFTAAFTFLTLTYAMSFDWVNFTSTGRAYLKLLMAYLAVETLGLRFFRILERHLYVLAAISLVGFVFQLLWYEPTLLAVSMLERAIPALDYRGDGYASAFVFTVNGAAQFRNSGCAWEPKGFANMLVLGIFLNLLFHRLKANRRLLVLSIALITTFSTAGYGAVLAGVLPMIAVNLPWRRTVWFIPVALIAGLGIGSLDFMYEKVAWEFETSARQASYVDLRARQSTKSLGRFGSLLVDLEDFSRHPMVGVGMQDSERTQGRYIRMVRVNGLSNTLSRFGLVGFLFLLCSLSVSASLLFRRHRMRGSPFLVIAVLVISFATALTLNPLWLALQLFSLTTCAAVTSKESALRSAPWSSTCTVSPS